MAVEIIRIIGGLLLLFIGGDLLLRGSLGLAKRQNASKLVMGLTVVAFASTAPELFICLGAGVMHRHDVLFGSLVGANILNISLVLALSVLVHPAKVAMPTVKWNWPILFFSGVVFYLVSFDNEIGHFEGMILLVVLFFVISRTVKPKNPITPFFNKKIKLPRQSSGGFTIMILISAIIMAIGSKLLVRGASELAYLTEISERLFSMLFVALGVCLPGLVTSVVAMIRKEVDLCVGNIIGTNILNVFAVLGLTATLQKIRIHFTTFQPDIDFMLVLYVLLFLFMVPFRSMVSHIKEGRFSEWWNGIEGGYITRLEGFFLLLVGAAYIAFIFIIERT